MNPPIWAPWRMEYILGPKDKTRCVFCEASTADEAHLRDSGVLVVTEHVCVMLNRYPFNAGHLLIVPLRHVDSLEELTDVEHAALWETTRSACTRLRCALGAQGINLGMNLGEVAGAGIADHAHVHLVPRWQGDMNFMPVIADMHVMPQHLDATWTRLYPFFADLPGRRAPAP